MRKVAQFLMERNDKGPSFVGWSTNKGAIVAIPASSDYDALLRDLRKAGLHMNLRLE